MVAHRHPLFGSHICAPVSKLLKIYENIKNYAKNSALFHALSILGGSYIIVHPDLPGSWIECDNYSNDWHIALCSGTEYITRAHCKGYVTFCYTFFIAPVRLNKYIICKLASFLENVYKSSFIYYYFYIKYFVFIFLYVFIYGGGRGFSLSQQ